MRMPDETALGPAVAPQSSRQIATYQPGAVQQAQMQSDQGLVQFGQDMTSAGQTFQDMQDRDAMAAGNQQILDAVNKAKADAQNSTDNIVGMGARAQQNLGNIVQQAASGIADNDKRRQFMAENGRYVSDAVASINNVETLKLKDAAKGNLLSNIDGVRSSFLNSLDDAARAKAFNTANDYITAAAKNGTIGQTEAYSIRKNTAATWPAQYYADLTKKDPALAMKELAPSPSDGSVSVSPLSSGEGDDGSGQPVTPLGDAIKSASGKYGVSSDTLARIAWLESRGGSDPGMGSRGPFQFTPDTAAKYGLTNPSDFNASADAAARLLKDNTDAMTTELGRAPTPAELYLAHQQGAKAAADLIDNPGENAVDMVREYYPNDAVARQAITGNGGNPDMTAGEFVKKWADKFNSIGKSSDDGGIAAARVIPARATDDGAVMFPKTGTMVDFIPPDKRIELWQQAVAKAGQNDAINRGDVMRRYNDGMAALMDGKPAPNMPSAGQLAAAFPDDDGKAGALAQQANDAQTYSGLLSKLPGMSADERDAATKALTPDPNQPGYEEKANLANMWNRAVAQWGQKVSADPAGAVFSSNDDLKAKYQPVLQAWIGGKSNPDDMGRFVSDVTALQDRIGVPPAQQTVLPEKTAQGLAAYIASDPQAAKDRMNGLEQQAGSAWPKLWSDIVSSGKLPPAYQAVGALDNERDAAMLSRWTNEGKDRNQDIANIVGGAKQEKAIRDYIQASPDVANFSHSLEASGASRGQINGIVQSIQDLAFAKAAYDRDPSAAANAVHSFLDKYDFMPNGGARVPSNIFDAVAANAHQTLQGITPDQVTIPPGFDTPGGPKGADYVRVLQAAPTWITSPRADALWLMDSQWRLVRDKAGQQVAVPFSAPAQVPQFSPPSLDPSVMGLP